MSDATIDFYSNPRLAPDNVTMRFGTGNDARLVWSTADADNHSLVLALGDANQALHVSDVGAVATDWNVTADVHPTLYVHSNTTPATDYLKIGGHDGTSATIDLVGGTTLKIAFDGSADIDISATALSPSSDGGNALGTTSLGWNGLHLNTGTVINWENGDVTLTHAAGKLTFGGDGAVEIDFANHEMTNVDIDSGAIDGTTIGASSVANGSFSAVVGTTGTYSGVLQTNDTTGATSDTTGALQVAGGLSAELDSFFGDDLTLLQADEPLLTVETTGTTKQASILLKMAAAATSGQARVSFQEGSGNGDANNMAYRMTFRPDNGYFSFSSEDTDGSSTVADIWRVAEGTEEMILNANHGTNFDYVCDECGKSSGEPFVCHGVQAPWHDDVALMELATRRDVGNMPLNVRDQLERLGILVIDRKNLLQGKEQVFFSISRMPWFLMSGMTQLHNRIKDLEVQLASN